MADLPRVAWVLGASRHRDVDGRFFGEGGEQPTSADELRRCPYAGSRAGQPMNVGALAQVNRHLDAVHQRLSAAQSALDASLSGAFGAVAACVLEAACWTEPVPVPVAATYKSLVGLRQVLGRLLLAHADLADVPLLELGTGGDFVELLEREGWLLGQHQVCAGSPKAIATLYDRLAAPVDAPPWWGAGKHRDVVVAMVAAQRVAPRQGRDPWLTVAHGLDEVRPERLVVEPSEVLRPALEDPSWSTVERLLEALPTR